MAPPNLPLGRAAGLRTLIVAGCGGALAAGGLLLATPAHAAGETVNIWLTTTSDAGGRTVTRGLQQQTPVAFAAGSGGASQTITVNEDTTLPAVHRRRRLVHRHRRLADEQQRRAVAPATRDTVMQKLFDPVNGIGAGLPAQPDGRLRPGPLQLHLRRHPPQTDPSTTSRIAHDLADVLPLTKQAKQLNPNLKVMAIPWTAPAVDEGQRRLHPAAGCSRSTTPLYAQYFVKYIQAYQAQGVHDRLRVAAERADLLRRTTRRCSWNASGLDYFTSTNLLPALHGRRPDHQGAGARLELGQLRRPTAAPAGQRRGHPQRPATSAASPGTATAATSASRPRCTTSTRAWTPSTPSTPAAPGSPTSRTRTCTTSSTTPATGAELGQVEPRGRPEHGPAQRRLRHLHRPDHRPQRRQPQRAGRLHRRVLHDGPPDQVREARRVPDRLHRQLHGAERRLAATRTAPRRSIAYNRRPARRSRCRSTGATSPSPTPCPPATSATFTWAGTPGTGGTAAGHGRRRSPATAASASTSPGRAAPTAPPFSSTPATAPPRSPGRVGSDGTLRALGKCLDVQRRAPPNGTQVQLYDCNGTAAQHWQHAGNDLVNPHPASAWTPPAPARPTAPGCRSGPAPAPPTSSGACPRCTDLIAERAVALPGVGAPITRDRLRRRSCALIAREQNARELRAPISRLALRDAAAAMAHSGASSGRAPSGLARRRSEPAAHQGSMVTLRARDAT